jgi:hypothetical protein
MELMGIKLLPVLVAAVATMVIGFLWYSPALFARPWMLAMGYDPNDKAKLDEMRKGAGKIYAIAFVASLVSAFVLAKIIELTTVNSVRYGVSSEAHMLVWGRVFDRSARVRDPRPQSHCQTARMAPYSLSTPPVSSRMRSTRCSVHQASSSSTIFSVAQGSQ